MKPIRLFVIFIGLLISSAGGYAQVTTIPEQAKEHFFKQYPDAKDVQWVNDVVNVNVKFEQDSNKLNAEYSNKGIWKKTLKEWHYDKLPADVKEGLSKSKYAGREVLETKVVYLPGYVIQYRLKVVKSDFERKFLYFNTGGRLVRTNVAL